MSPRLSRAGLALARPGAWMPAPERELITIGVLHFGPGAFHRAHQAWYLDRALDTDPRWGICAVSLRSRTALDALAPQDGLYTLVALGERTDMRIVRALREVLLGSAPGDRARVFARFEDPALHLVTLTVTEKGYCLAADGTLDVAHPDVVADLADPVRPGSVLGWLVEGLRRRRARRLAPPTIASCDNGTGNGERLRRAIVSLAALRDASLADWIAAEVPFPCSMVDSITPAATAALRERVERDIGLRDEAAVQREDFCQWVLENRLGPVVPDFAALGVTVTSDVAAFERAKLRILNGAHSTLAYLGLLRGFVTVGEAIADPELARHVSSMLSEEVLPGLDGRLGDYTAATLRRFRNRELRHELAQIAWDGSQKLPYRILETIAENLEAGRPITRLAATLAAWLLFLRRAALQHRTLVDPLAPSLLELGSGCSGEPGADVARLLALREVFPAALASDPRLARAIEAAYRRLCSEGAILLT